MLKIQATNGNHYGIDWEYFFTHLPLSGKRVIKTIAKLYNTSITPYEQELEDGRKVLVSRLPMGQSEAVCSTKDLYDKGLGRRKSMARLIKRYSHHYNGGLLGDKALRKQIWDNYFKMCNDLEPKLKVL